MIAKAPRIIQAGGRFWASITGPASTLAILASSLFNNRSEDVHWTQIFENRARTPLPPGAFSARRNRGPDPPHPGSIHPRRTSPIARTNGRRRLDRFQVHSKDFRTRRRSPAGLHHHHVPDAR